MGSVCVLVADPSITKYCFENKLPKAAYVFSGASFHQPARLIRECCNPLL